MARAQQRARRNFGRIERLPSGRYRDGYTGPDGQLSRAPTTFDAKDDAIAWLSARRAEIQMEVWAPDDASRVRSGASRRPSGRTPTSGWKVGRPRAASCGRRPVGSTGCCSTSSSSRPSATSGSTGSRTRTSTPGTTTWRPAGRRSGRSRTACCAPSSPARPRSDRRRSSRTTPRAPGAAGDAGRAGDDRRRATDRYQVMALLAAWCAMRFGELTELRRGVVDLRANRVKIRRGEVRVDGKFIVGPPKSDAGSRDVAIPPHLLPRVRDHLSRHGAGQGRVAIPGSCRRQPAHGAFDALQGLLPGAEGGGTSGPALARPAPYRRRSGCPGRCHARRAHGSSGSLHTRSGVALSARRRGPRRGDRAAPVGARRGVGPGWEGGAMNDGAKWGRGVLRRLRRQENASRAGWTVSRRSR